MSANLPSPEDGSPELAAARSVTLVVYVLHALTFVTLVTHFVAIIINYASYGSVRGTLYESHFDWQKRTFWYSLGWFVLACVLMVWGFIRSIYSPVSAMLVLGVALGVINLLWYIYRVILGFVGWSERKPMPFRA